VTHDIVEAILLADRVVLLSARPGTILGTFTVRAAKPRPGDFLRCDEFVELHTTLLERFPPS
jgi:ABC-type nitrate/sulfonate/bicarbonate transport system ATPase subunit